jgi:hypothetical protein
VRRVTQKGIVNNLTEVQGKDFEANDLPRPERAREKEPVIKARSHQKTCTMRPRNA